MAKYYTISLFSPSTKSSRYTYRRVASQAPSGFVFHDTEEPLSPNTVRRALFVLSELFEESTGAWLVAVNDHTIAATFSLAGVPKPTTVSNLWDRSDAYEWLQRSNLQGWFLPNVKDPSSTLVQLKFDDLYNGCTELNRLSGLCPCPKQQDMTCTDEVVYPKLQNFVSLDRLKSNYSDIDATQLVRARYVRIGDFQYVSPAKTTRHDFDNQMRAWDVHEFDVVDSRQAEFKARGMRRHLNVEHRKKACSQCAFSPNKEKGYDCGQVSRCQGSVTEDQLWAHLHTWYSQSGFDSMDPACFTQDQRNYLIGRGGVRTRMCFGGSTRNSTVHYGGFVQRSGQWTYVMSGAAGDRSRREYFNSYADLKQRLHADLPDTPPPVSLDYKTLLACAIGGSKDRIYTIYRGSRRISTVELLHDHVVFSGNSTTYAANVCYIKRDGTADHYYDALNGEYARATAAANLKYVHGT